MLPNRPPKYGDLKPYALDPNLIIPRVNPVVPNLSAPDMGVDVTPAGYVVSWYVGDLPPPGTVSANEEFAVFTDENLHVHNHGATVEDHEPMPTEICGAWNVTARAVDHDFQGEITVACRQESGGLVLWRRG